MRSRARKLPDVGRIAEALRRPGIDPREWITLAILDPEKPLSDSVRVFEDCIVADVVTVGDNRPVTGYVLPLWSAPGQGVFMPITENALFVVLVPDADWLAGAYLWGPIPTADEMLPKKNGLLFWKNDKIGVVSKFMIDALIQEKVNVETTDDVTVKTSSNLTLDYASGKIGSTSASESMILGDKLVTEIGKIQVPTPMGFSGFPINAAAFEATKSVKTKVA